jgi:hypothetical protein
MEPRSRGNPRSSKALEEFDRAIEQVLAESGMTRDELADLLDLSKPLPRDT